jgi:hypothetical protein
VHFVRIAACSLHSNPLCGPCWLFCRCQMTCRCQMPCEPCGRLPFCRSPVLQHAAYAAVREHDVLAAPRVVALHLATGEVEHLQARGVAALPGGDLRRRSRHTRSAETRSIDQQLI